jgi:hypothetical protein
MEQFKEEAVSDTSGLINERYGDMERKTSFKTRFFTSRSLR